MAETHDSGPGNQPEELLLDRIDAMRVLRAGSREAKDAVLEQVAGRGKPEQDIISELAKVRPLWRPDRFEEAHRMAMRSLEILDRNGARAPQVAHLGPLRPIARYVIGQMTRWIVKGHQNALITRIRKLYERREANSIPGTPERAMLRRARVDAQRVEPGYKGNPLGLPTFLLGGAILSTIMSGLQALVRWAFGGVTEAIILTVILCFVFAFLAWAALYSAGVARRRIRLSTEQPISALWETIGACGNPPRDSSYDFAVIAIVLLVLAWVLVPLSAYLIISNVA